MPARRIGVTIVALLAATPALAHSGPGHTDGFGHGFLHPLLGVDHLLAMMAVGLWAALSAPRLFYAAPAGFMIGMLAGGAAGSAGLAPLGLEAAIASSVLILGLLSVLEVRAHAALAFTGAALLGGFHGIAHGSEMPIDFTSVLYGAGFLSATALLHATGIGMGLLSRRLVPNLAGRTIGGFVAFAGAAMLIPG